MLEEMNSTRKYGWQEKVRGYRVRRAIVAVAESVCLAMTIASLDGALAWIAASVWLGWRWYASPGERQIGAWVEKSFPSMQRLVVPAIELRASDDPSVVKGSADLIESVQRDLDRTISAVPVNSLVSFKPLMTVALLAGCVHVTTVLWPKMPSPPITGGTDRPVISAVQPDRSTIPADADGQRRQLQALEESLRQLPGDLLRQLPADFRSVQSSLEESALAMDARQRQDWREASRLEADVAERLGEFARVAGEIGALNTLAAQSDELSRSFAQTAESAGFQVAVPGQSAVIGTGSENSTSSSPLGSLPATVSKAGAWSSVVEKMRDTTGVGLGLYSGGYGHQILGHFEQVGRP